MKYLLVAAFLLFASSSFAKEVRLICTMGGIADMDIVLTKFEASSEERLRVIVYGMDGETVTVFQNSTFEKGALFRNYERGRVYSIVSRSDLKNKFGGAYLSAGLLDMTYNQDSKKYDVLFAAQEKVYTAACAPQ